MTGGVNVADGVGSGGAAAGSGGSSSIGTGGSSSIGTGKPRLFPAPHQVSGHRFEEGRLGSLVDEDGRFYKPLQSGERGMAEVRFYQKLNALAAENPTELPPHIAAMFPRFYGVEEVPVPVETLPKSVSTKVEESLLSTPPSSASAPPSSSSTPSATKPAGAGAAGGSSMAGPSSSEMASQLSSEPPPQITNSYMVMEDVAKEFRRPCVMDIKMGRRTWFDGAPQKYIDKCLKKDAETTSGRLGFRIGGMQVYDPKAGKSWRADRRWCKDVTPEGMPAALLRFVSNDPSGSGAPCPTLMRQVYGVQQQQQDNGKKAPPQILIDQLQQLRNWFATQTTFHFYSSSILIIYEGEVTASSTTNVAAISNGDSDMDTNTDHGKIALRIVDFAHAIDGNGKVDSNFLEAINAFMAAVQALVA